MPMAKKIKELIKLLEEDGWILSRQKGSHKQYNHPVKPGTVTVTDHGKSRDVDDFIVNSIMKQAGLK